MNGLDSPQGRMLELTFVSLVVQRAIYAAAKLGIADLLAEAARTSDELADSANADRDATYRLLRALASAGILEEHEGRSFNLTDVGTTLRSDVPGSMLLKYIVHDWGDESAIRILTNCRAAMADGGRVLLIETVVPGPEQPDYAKLGDLEMLVLLGSRERAVAEYDALLGGAGFARTRIVPTSEHLKIIEAVAVA